MNESKSAIYPDKYEEADKLYRFLHVVDEWIGGMTLSELQSEETKQLAAASLAKYKAFPETYGDGLTLLLDETRRNHTAAFIENLEFFFVEDYTCVHPSNV